MMQLLAEHPLAGSLIMSAAMAMACSILSVLVVLRRWAFVGEGIAHAGFGGAGTAWMLSLAFPTVGLFSHHAGIFAVAVLFCLVVGLAIGYVTRHELIRSDSAIGIFLVASLAWGFIANGIYMQMRNGVSPPDWPEYMRGGLGELPPQYVIAAVLLCVAVLVIMFAMGREIIYYSFDPVLAQVSGVRVGAIHHLLILLVTLTILIGMRMMGSLLVAALLVLPGATALLLSRNLKKVLALSFGIALIGSLAGPLLNAHWRFLPAGPAIVIVLVIEFVLVYFVGRPLLSYAWRSNGLSR